MESEKEGRKRLSVAVYIFLWFDRGRERDGRKNEISAHGKEVEKDNAEELLESHKYKVIIKKAIVT